MRAGRETKRERTIALQVKVIEQIFGAEKVTRNFQKEKKKLCNF